MKLIIKSRFSWTYFLIIFVFFAYAGVAVLSSQAPTGVALGDYYFAGMLALFSVVSILTGGLSMTKSDSEFLLVSPVERRTLSSALYIGQYLFTGPLIFVAFLVYALTAPYGPDVRIILFAYAIFLSTLPVSLSVASANLHLKWKLSAAALFVVWVFSFRLGFQYSPVSMFQGHLYSAIIPAISLSVILLAASLFLLSSDKLEYRLLDRSVGKSEYKHIKDYTDITPERAIFRYGFSRFEMATRTNFSGTPTLSGRRIRANFVLAVFVVAALLYGYTAYHFNPKPGSFINVNIITLTIGIYLGVFPPLIISGSTMPMERAWLSFTSMRPSRYVPLLTLAKMFQLIYFFTAFAAVDVALYFLGVYGAINNLLLFLVIDPLFLVFFMALNFRVQSYQIKDDKLITSRYSASQFILIPPMLVFFAVAGISSLFLLVDLFIIPIAAAIVALIMLWKGFWDKRVNKLVEKGFI
ncbi:hypothetical protein IX51_10105 [uncultured archaeon]|nr:hypothetical protein IX51_10105 [uncultured archaeon]